jgi:hypothetical protein
VGFAASKKKEKISMSNWIKMRSNLWNDTRIAKICDITNKPEREVIGGLYWIWSMADEQSTDGRLEGLSLGAIDRKTGFKGLGAALVKVGWILEDEDGVEIARFDEHNGASAKKRAVMAKASSRYRSSSSDRHAPSMTDALRVDDLDKNRIDNTPISPQGDIELVMECEPTPAPPHPVLTRFRNLFHIRAETPLDSSATRAWEKNKKAAADVSEEDWRFLEWAYRQKEGAAAQFRRKDLSTLLNNILAEVTRARDWAGRSGMSLSAAPAVSAEPEGWQDLVTSEFPECNLSTWSLLPDSMKAWVREKHRTQAAA